MKNANEIIVKLSGVLLLIAVLPLPYEYYQLLRLIIFVSGFIVAYEAYSREKISWTIVFGCISLLFNPIAPIYLSKGVWIVIDIVVAVLFFNFPKLLQITNKSTVRQNTIKGE